MVYKHPADNHGGAYKGAIGQQCFKKSMESHYGSSAQCEKTSKDLDIRGADFIFKRKDSEVSVSVKTSWKQQTRNYIPISVGSDSVSGKIPNIFNSNVEAYAFWNIPIGKGEWLIVEAKKLVQYIRDNFEEAIQDKKSSDDIQKSIDGNMMYKRRRVKDGNYYGSDYLIYAPYQDIAGIACSTIPVVEEFSDISR